MISRTLKKQDLIGGGGHCILAVPHDGLPASTSFYTTRAQVRHKRMRSVVQGGRAADQWIGAVLLCLRVRPLHDYGQFSW